MTIGDAILLGIVQGITEFLPISSSGHLILAREFFGITSESGLLFDAMLHFATACAVACYFWKDIVQIARSGFSALGFGTEDRSLSVHIVIATIPAVVLGYVLESSMETVFRNPVLVAITLIAGAGIMFAAEWHYARRQSKTLHASGALLVGFFQSLALVPGMSRSGMAIAGGMFAGLDRVHATRFAFVLAVPLLCGAGLKKIIDVFVFETASADLVVISAGVIAAVVTGVMAMHYMLVFLRTNTLWPFICYRVFLAVVVLIVLA